MAEIKSTAKIKCLFMEREIVCPSCLVPVPYYDSTPIIEIDFDDITKQLDRLGEERRFTETKIIIEIQSGGYSVFGFPVEFRCKEGKE